MNKWVVDALVESGVIAPEEKKFKNIILQCTGQLYDGVDEEFEAIISKHFPRYTGVIAGVTNSRTIVGNHLYSGEPLFHISSLLYVCKSVIDSSDPIEEKRYLCRLIVPYIMKWIDSQVQKLIAYENASGQIVEANQLSEFHLSVNIFKKIKDDYVTELCLDSMLQVLSSISLILELHDLVLLFAERLNQLEKILSKVMNREPILLKKSNLHKFNNILTVFRFETSVATLTSLVKLEKYTLAEVYANKCLSVINKLHVSHRKKCMHYLSLNFALFAKSANDIEAVLSHLAKVFDCSDEDAYYIAFVQKFATYFPSVCEFAARYFEDKGEVDKAIKYYSEAARHSDSEQDQLKYITNQKSLVVALAKQLAAELMTPEYQAIFSKVAGYPKPKAADRGLLFLYTHSENSALLLRRCLLKNKIDFSNLANPRTDIEKNALALEIDYEFDADILKTVLQKVIVQQQKEAKLLRKKARELPDESALIEPKQETKDNFEEMESPKRASRKSRKKKVVNVSESSTIKVNKWAFLEQQRSRPLKIVEFKQSNKIFDPANPKGVVTLHVNNMQGRWYAYVCTEIIEYFQKDKIISRVFARFHEETVLANDLCVPCFKEMDLKSREHKVDLPYVFKIRLKGSDGKSDIRIYAEVIEILETGEKLVVFSAMNDKSHARHSIPIRLIKHEAEVKNLNN